MMKRYTALDSLKEKREAYVMYHEQHGIEVKCTPKYRKFWVARGFKEVTHSKRMSLV